MVWKWHVSYTITFPKVSEVFPYLTEVESDNNKTALVTTTSRINKLIVWPEVNSADLFYYAAIYALYRHTNRSLPLSSWSSTTSTISKQLVTFFNKPFHKNDKSLSIYICILPDANRKCANYVISHTYVLIAVECEARYLIIYRGIWNPPTQHQLTRIGLTRIHTLLHWPRNPKQCLNTFHLIQARLTPLRHVYSMRSSSRSKKIILGKSM